MLEHATMLDSEKKCFLYIKFQKLAEWGAGGLVVIFLNKQNHQSFKKVSSWLFL